MANWFTKKISGLDFWDTEENRNQRQQFAQDDEEERRRKEQERAAQASVVRPNNQPRPGAIVTPQPTKPLATVGSLSDFSQPKPGGLFQPGQPLQKAQVTPPKPVVQQPVQPAPAVVPNAAEIRQKAIAYKTPKVQDVGGYYAGDAKILEEELAKGDQADMHRVQGLMTSLDNRTKELKDFHNARGENTSFKTARELQDTIKDTRGDWTKQNDQLKQFWDGVSTSELADFNAYLRANGKQPATQEDVMQMVAGKDAWKNGTGKTYAPDFSKDTEAVKAVQTRQKIADAAKQYADVPLDQLGDRTIQAQLTEFEFASPENQRKMLKEYEDILTNIGDNPSQNPEQERKAQQAYFVYNTLLDSGKQQDNFHTKFNKFTDAASKFGGALIQSPKHVVQSVGALAGDDPMGDVWNDWQAGKISDEEFNAKMNQAKKDYEWVPESGSSTAKNLMVAAGTSADTVATFLPVASFIKGAKGAVILNTLVKEGVASGLTREAASVAAKETLANLVKEGGVQSLKNLTAQEALANATFSGVGSLRTGEFDPAQTAKETAFGGAIGGAAPVLGSKASQFWNKLRGVETAAPQAVEDVGRVTTRLETGAADNVARASAVNSETVSRMNELQQVLDDPSIPSYQKLPMKEELAQLQQEAADDVARSMGVADDALDKPAFQHKQDIQNVINEEEAKLTQLIDESPGISQVDIEAAQQAAQTRALSRIQELKDIRTASVTSPNIPDVANPVTLAKADGSVVGPAVNEAPIADFSKAVDAPLQKAERVNAAPAKVEATPEVTAEGNAAIISDQTLQNRAEAMGAAPARGESVVGMGEQRLEKAAEQATRDEVNAGGPAPRTREQAANRITDETLRADIMDNFPEKETLNLQTVEDVAKSKVNNMSDEQLVASFSQTPVVDTPEGYLTAVNSIRRLEAIGTPEAKAAIQNAIDGLANYASKSGQGLRVTQMLFEDMPTTMKADYLMKKIGNAGVEMTDADRSMLLNLIERSDGATDALRKLQDEATSLMESGGINNKSMSSTTRDRVSQLSKDIQEATRMKEMRAGEAWKFYQDQLPKGPLGKRFADIGRTMMLSSPTGRAFDVFSTTATTMDDLLTQGTSNLIGKVLNKAPGVKAGTLTDTILSPRKLAKGFREGLRRVGKSLKGQEGVEDFMTEARKATRGDISRGGTVRRTVRSLVEAPTELTRGLQEQELFRQGMQEASQQGLKGSARRAYAELRAAVPSKAQLEQAVEVHMKANMLHNNKISRFLNGIAQSLDKGGHGWGAVFIRNQVAPFTSWVGGFMHRTLTDKNVVYNAFKIAQSAGRRDIQGVVDNVAKLGVNTGEAYAAGMLLTKAGIITTQDANGDSYGGLYFHIGNRYIPVAIAGTVSVPLIWGNALQQAMDASDDGKSPMEAFGNSLLVNTMKNTGVQSFFGGENTLQTTVSSLTDDKGAPSDAIAKYVGDFTRQYIPGLMSDVNALLDYNKSLNPTGEAALTKVTKENPETGRDKTDVGATEWNKTLNKIPFASQNLPRDEGKPARDILDRATKGNHETGAMVEEKKVAETKAQREKRRKEDDVPDTKEGIQARVEEGDFDNAITGWKQQIENLNEQGKDAKPSDKKEAQDEIKRLQITKDSGYGYEMIKLYSDVSLSDWRKMIDPEDEEYDPETAQKLAAYDKKLADAGVSKGKFSEKPKYSAKKGSGKGPKFGTSIATQSFKEGGNFAPQKAQSASFAVPGSAIPVLEKAKNYDQSKLKKITVKKGA